MTRERPRGLMCVEDRHNDAPGLSQRWEQVMRQETPACQAEEAGVHVNKIVLFATFAPTLTLVQIVISIPKVVSLSTSENSHYRKGSEATQRTPS
jgi:hypothetical protein